MTLRKGPGGPSGPPGLTASTGICYCLCPPRHEGLQEYMAKQRRVTDARSPRKKTPERPKRPTPPRRSAAAPAGSAPAEMPAPAPAPAKKPAYYEAIAIYETGVRALQRHDF